MLDARKEIEELRQLYAARQSSRLLSILIIGGSGTGKTTLACSGRRPVHIDSFDPDGTVSVRRGIEEGWIIADTRFEDGDFYLWDEVIHKRIKSGYFNNIGTYVLDSFTTFSDAVMGIVLRGLTRKADRAPGGRGGAPIHTEYLKIPQENDWPLQMNICMNALNGDKGILRLPCDVIVIGHLEDRKNKNGNVIAKGLYCTGKLLTRIPRLFQELYICGVEETSKGLAYYVQTQPEGLVEARTRLGAGGLLSFREPHNIERMDTLMQMMRKCGLDPKHKDMPWLEGKGG